MSCTAGAAKETGAYEPPHPLCPHLCAAAEKDTGFQGDIRVTLVTWVFFLSLVTPQAWRRQPAYLLHRPAPRGTYTFVKKAIKSNIRFSCSLLQLREEPVGYQCTRVGTLC